MAQTISIDEFLEKMRAGLNEYSGYIKIDYKNEYRDRTPKDWCDDFIRFTSEFQFNFELTGEKMEDEE